MIFKFVKFFLHLPENWYVWILSTIADTVCNCGGHSVCFILSVQYVETIEQSTDCKIQSVTHQSIRLLHQLWETFGLVKRNITFCLLGLSCFMTMEEVLNVSFWTVHHTVWTLSQELIYLYFPPSFHLTVGCFCPCYLK